MKFELSHDRRSITNQDLIADMHRVATAYANSQFTQALYRQHGKYGCTTTIKRFGTWNAAVEAAGLRVIRKKNISEQELFTALGELWIRLGRQPKYAELTKPYSPYSAKPYEQRFGSWRKALEAFVAFANSEDRDGLGIEGKDPELKSRRTSRSINLRLRWKVLQRDNCRCCSCGASPALTPGTEFEFDHIIPWSKGGETQLDNLQTLCRACNQGKSNQ